MDIIIIDQTIVLKSVILNMISMNPHHRFRMIRHLSQDDFLRDVDAGMNIK